MKVLVTGFNPFGDETINPAYAAVKKLPDTIDNHEIIKKIIPTEFKKSSEVILKYIKQIQPDITICVGQAGGRNKITVERIAINIDDARIQDNAGEQPIDEKIRDNGANAYFSNLPIKRMVKLMKDNDIPAAVSNSAGTYVCNHIMYEVLYIADQMLDKKMYGGFIHVPFIHSQVINKNAPSMSLDDIINGLKYAIIAAVDTQEDDKIVGGTLH